MIKGTRIKKPVYVYCPFSFTWKTKTTRFPPSKNISAHSRVEEPKAKISKLGI